MKNKTGNINLNAEKETAVQTIAARMSKQIRLAVAGSFREMLFVLREDRRRSVLHTATDRDDFLTADEVAKILKISKSQAYHMIRRREIPSFSIGRTGRVRHMDLEAVIEAHTVR